MIYQTVSSLLSVCLNKPQAELWKGFMHSLLYTQHYITYVNQKLINYALGRNQHPPKNLLPSPSPLHFLPRSSEVCLLHWALRFLRFPSIVCGCSLFFVLFCCFAVRPWCSTMYRIPLWSKDIWVVFSFFAIAQNNAMNMLLGATQLCAKV